MAMNRDEARRAALAAGQKGINGVDAHELTAAIERFEDAIELLKDVVEDGQ